MHLGRTGADLGRGPRAARDVDLGAEEGGGVGVAAGRTARSQPAADPQRVHCQPIRLPPPPTTPKNHPNPNPARLGDVSGASGTALDKRPKSKSSPPP